MFEMKGPSIDKFIKGKFALLFLVISALAGITFFSGPKANAVTDNCNNDAVLYCGVSSPANLLYKYNNGDSKNSALSTQHIYSWFGISSDDIKNISSDLENGSVSTNGDVYVNGNVVATDAITAGRTGLTSACGGSTQVISQNTKFYTRSPCVSFTVSSVPAYVVMKNNVFQFAILTSCGNPVKAQPKTIPAQPSYTIDKEVALMGSSNYSKNLTVKAGTQVEYRIMIKNTGQSSINNLNISDKLSDQISFISNSLQKDGNTISQANFFSSGLNVGELAAGAITVITYEATVGSTTSSSCQQPLNNIAYISANGLSPENSQAAVNEQCQPKPPVVSCNSLTSSPVSSSAYTFKASASSQNSIIKSYTFNFGDNSSPQIVATANTNATAQHMYSSPGTYLATVSVDSSGVNTPVTSSACQTSITISPPPAAACSNLQITQNPTDPRSVTATASYQVSNGVTLKSITYNFGDGVTVPPTTSNTTNYTYQQDGNYIITATLAFSGSQPIQPSTCQVPITVMTAQPVCNLLQVSNNNTNTATITDFETTANGGTFTGADVNWGDGTTNSLVNPVVGQNHQYIAPSAGTSATYTVTVVPHFDVNGQDTTATSDACSQQVVISTPATPAAPTTPSSPVASVSLVNTGPGSIIGIFLGAIVIGFIGYRYFLRRHLKHL
jgi:uncharacterized repeat protein (TIGR01451 family)